MVLVSEVGLVGCGGQWMPISRRLGRRSCLGQCGQLGGSRGSGAVGGSGAIAGAGGGGAVAGTGGGTAGAAGSPAYCCTTSMDCPQYYEGDGEDEAAPLANECVNGVCKPTPPYMQCWDDNDCPYGMCQGAFVCPCTADCDGPDSLGWCAAPPPPPPDPYCCKTDWDCGDYAYVPCVNGVCMMPVPGACWTSAECAAGEQCVGASVCPCGALCGIADTPGKCM
jgi:hypothetical protein